MGTPDEHLLKPGQDGGPFLSHLIAVIGFDRTNFFLRLYSQDSLALAKDVFDRARQTERIGPVFIYVSAPRPKAESARRSGLTMEVPLPLNKNEILEKFRIAERRQQRENWQDIMESYCDDKQAAEFALEKAEKYGIPHQTMDELFEFVLHDGQARYPIQLFKVGQSIDKAALEGIPSKDFAQALHDVIRHCRTKREDSLVTETPIDAHDMLGSFESLFLKSVDRVVEYEGAGTARLADVIRYKMMDLKLIEGPPAVERRNRTRTVPNLPAPFPPIDFDLRDPSKFTTVHPPREGEPEVVTHVRILLEWVEQHGGEKLRDCLAQALGKGSVRIGNAEEDIFTSPLHKLSAAIKEKMRVPYFVNELCLNHGLTAWEMIAAYDAAADAAEGVPPVISGGR